MDYNDELINLSSSANEGRALISPSMGNHQLVIISQLLKLAENMHHFDELLIWLSRVILQRFNIEAIQFWAVQATPSGRFCAELRTMAVQNDALPHYVIVNAQIAEFVEQILQERRGMIARPVNTLFSQAQTRLLYRYDLNYWASYFLSNNALLPPAVAKAANGKTATPLTMNASLFIRQAPNPRLLPTLGNILEQAVSIAKHHGLLFTEQTLPENIVPTTSSPRMDAAFDLAECIPRHTHSTKHIRGQNPFTTLVLIPEKRLRSLYNDIDGKKTIGELSTTSQMDKKEFSGALRQLLLQGYIQLYTLKGQRVEDTKIFANL